MIISILGTGMVGQSLAQKLQSLGHEIYMGTRDAEKTKARTEVNNMTGKSFADWLGANSDIRLRDYAELPDASDLFINASNGEASIKALQAVGKDKLKNKVILDLANPLDFSQGFPPSLSISNTNSLAESIQKEFAESKVVKSLNTMNYELMMNPSKIKGDHSVFLSGNDENAKSRVKGLLQEIGWPEQNIFDLGDISTARGTEMMLPIWLRLYAVLGHSNFNFHLAM